MYVVKFYEDECGNSDLWEFMEQLRKKSATSKDARIQYKQIRFCIELLQENGTVLPDNITKHIVDDIWELRLGCNRIFYFFTKTIHLFCCIIFARGHRKHLKKRLKKQSREEIVTFPERRRINNENMGRL